jgi:hypothetical protein
MQMSKFIGYLAEAEWEAMDSLKVEIGAHLLGVMDGVHLIEKSFGALKDTPYRRSRLCQRVAFGLAIKLGNDLRSIAIVSGIGMPTQAVGLAAGSFETAYTLSYIAGNDQRASAWIEYNDPTRPFEPIRNIVATVLEQVMGSRDEEQIERRYRDYRQLCLGKHGNPLFVKHHSLRMEGSSVLLSLGPTTSEVAVRALQFALEQALGHATLALAALANVEEVLRRDESFIAELDRLNSEWSHLHKAAVERWGAEDPFEGKW